MSQAPVPPVASCAFNSLANLEGYWRSVHRMLRQLFTLITVRPASSTPAKLQPGELERLVDSLPEVARKLRARQARLRGSPRSVSTSLKDLCEL